MDLGLRGRVAAVTASSRGIGRAVAVALAQEGADVAICARHEDALRDAEAEVARHGGRVLSLVADLATPDGPALFVERVTAEFGRLDVLFTNTGGPPTGAWDSFGMEAYEEAVQANLLAHVRMCMAAVPHMRRGGWGRIVMLGSLSMKQPVEGLVLSTTARAGLAGFAKSLADELGPEGITVNAVMPGRILTDRIRALAEERSRRTGEPFEASLNAFERDIPLRRIGTPDEFAALVAFLASERASYITGAAIQVDGGMARSLT